MEQAAAHNEKRVRAAFFVLRACVRSNTYASTDTSGDMLEYVSAKYTTDELVKLLVTLEKGQ